LFAGPVAAQHGWGFRQHPRRLLTFALEATLPMPSSPPPFFARALDVPEFEVDEKLAKHGLGVYGQTCFLCHGGGAISGGYAPDLRASPLTLSREAFVDVVKNGARQSAGMPRFTYFTDRDIDGLLHYVRQQARKAVAP
jgi:quinohemoprotein ethanol dehydrogenase